MARISATIFCFEQFGASLLEVFGFCLVITREYEETRSFFFISPFLIRVGFYGKMGCVLMFHGEGIIESRELRAMCGNL